MSISAEEIHASISISPFSIRNHWSVEWATEKEGWNGIEKGRGMLTEKGYAALVAIENIGFCTNLQLGKLLKKDLREGKQAAKKLERLGFLLRHQLVNGRRNSIDFYSLGPNCRGIVKGYRPMQEHPSAFTVLEKLVAFQLYVRFKEKYDLYTRKTETGLEFVFANTPIKILSLKGSPEQYQHRLKRLAGDARYIIILEQLTDISKYLETHPETNNIRLTTDTMLITRPIQNAFYKYQNGEFVPDVG